MVSRALPYEVTNILKELEFLSSIPADHKVNIQDKTLQDKNSWWDAWYRYRKNVDRKSTLRDIQKIIDDTANALTMFHHEPEYIKLIINALRKASYSIREMGKTTYRNDANIVSDIEVILKTIKILLNKYQQYLYPLPHIDSPPPLPLVLNSLGPDSLGPDSLGPEPVSPRATAASAVKYSTPPTSVPEILSQATSPRNSISTSSESSGKKINTIEADIDLSLSDNIKSSKENSGTKLNISQSTETEYSLSDSDSDNGE